MRYPLFLLGFRPVHWQSIRFSVLKGWRGRESDWCSVCDRRGAISLMTPSGERLAIVQEWWCFGVHRVLKKFAYRRLPRGIPYSGELPQQPVCFEVLLRWYLLEFYRHSTSTSCYTDDCRRFHICALVRTPNELSKQSQTKQLVNFSRILFISKKQL